MVATVLGIALGGALAWVRQRVGGNSAPRRYRCTLARELEASPPAEDFEIDLATPTIFREGEHEHSYIQ